jgi:hypothetical protein
MGYQSATQETIQQPKSKLLIGLFYMILLMLIYSVMGIFIGQFNICFWQKQRGFGTFWEF